MQRRFVEYHPEIYRVSKGSLYHRRSIEVFPQDQTRARLLLQDLRRGRLLQFPWRHKRAL